MHSWKSVTLTIAFAAVSALVIPTRPVFAAAPQTLYAAPDGHGGTCSQDRPCSLSDAQHRVRDLTRSMSSDVVVQLADGTYRLSEPLTFTAADSGTGGHQVIWQAAPGAHPVLSGGRQITGWRLIDPATGLWSAPANGSTRQLYINGARIPVAQGTAPVALTQTTTGFTAADATYAGWRNPSGIEFVFTGGNGSWTESRCRVASVNGTQITMQQPCWNNITNRPMPPIQVAAGANFPNMSTTATPNRIEDAYELLHPGQWYLDGAQHRLYYMATPGQNLKQDDVEMPVLQTLVSGNGTLDQPVQNITLRGLTFAYATWLDPSGPNGFAEVQANLRITGDQQTQPEGTCTYTVPAGTCPFGAYSQDPAAVTWRAAHDVTIESDTFTHLGAAGLNFAYGSQNNVVQGNEFTDISGIGIELGSSDDPHPSDVGADNREINLGNTIENNYIHNIGVEYSGADGILLFFSQQTTVTHNDIWDVPWDGIDSGAVQGHLDSPDHPDLTTNVNSDNTISDNLIYDYHTVLADGGAIYLEGHQGQTILNADGSVNEDASFQHGTMVTGNVVFDDLHSGLTLYDDIGTDWITWQNNVEFGNSYGNGGCKPIGHFRFLDNYHADQIAVWPCGLAPTDLQYSGNVQIPLHPSPSDMPADILSAAGLQPAYWYLTAAAAPLVTRVTPRSDPPSTPTPVVVTGNGFTPDSAVSFGGTPAAATTVLSPAFIFATVPVGAEASEATVRTAAGSASGPSGLPLREVTADSMDNEVYWDTSFTPYNVVDGNLNSFWSSGETAMPHWIQVQFTQPLTISKVVVRTRRFGDMTITDATLSTSTGGAPLQQVGAVTGNSAQDIPFALPTPSPVDTVRVQVNAETVNGGSRIEADIAQIDFYDANGNLIGNPPL
ncbi:MAG TPA: discoidin domain-containing protein [Actinocrinis sp.]|uniref:discoidin domain-containing protein n=1 Tax=Actinocrinis sp. TaxID=1920516 RepID=UPI002DDD7B21|nr:discoidin domain-containing protein [Actinocrinis sp.]HEV3173826.1 discoidin domain-containing protein [Actinocrinis sp.]